MNDKHNARMHADAAWERAQGSLREMLRWLDWSRHGTHEDDQWTKDREADIEDFIERFGGEIG